MHWAAWLALHIVPLAVYFRWRDSDRRSEAVGKAFCGKAHRSLGRETPVTRLAQDEGLALLGGLGHGRKLWHRSRPGGGLCATGSEASPVGAS